MIDIAKLKELVALMTANDLSEVNIKAGDETVSIRRGAQGGTVVNHQPVIYQGAPAGGGAMTAQMTGQGAPMSAAAMPAPAAVQAAPSATAKAERTASIDSPMVGTFYSKPSPDAKVFVTPGQSVTPDTVVCIIEAMKVFNEIKAEKAGVIDSILAKDGQAVEFGQKLFGLK